MKETLKNDGSPKAVRRGGAATRAAALAAFLLPACAAATPAQTPADDSQPPAREQRARPLRREAAGPGLVRALNLSPEQRAEIARIRREVEPQTRAANLRVRRARLALEEAVYAPVADESLIEPRAAEVAAAEGARARLRAETELRIRRLLTPDQLDAFRELRLRALAEQRQLRQSRRPARQRRRLLPPRQ